MAMSRTPRPSELVHSVGAGLLVERIRADKCMNPFVAGMLALNLDWTATVARQNRRLRLHTRDILD